MMNPSDSDSEEDFETSCLESLYSCFRRCWACRVQPREDDTQTGIPLVQLAMQTRSHPCGLVNLGNTCYMNAALQCLNGVVPLRKHLAVPQSVDTRIDNKIGASNTLAVSFSKLLHKMWSEESSAVRADDLKVLLERYVNKFSGSPVNVINRFGDHSQQDSHEFLTYMLQSLQEDLKKPRPLKGSEITKMSDDEEQKLSDVELARRKWTMYLEYNNSEVVDLFQGQFKATMTCGNTYCGKVMRTFDPFMFLPLPIPINSSSNHDDNEGTCTHKCTLEDCFKLWTKEQTTVKQNWYCEKCGREVEMKRKVDVWKPPQYLIIQLKRFRANETARYKMDTPIQYALDLDLSSFVQGSKDSRAVYGLFAVINHHGSIQGGHYTAATKHGDTWYEFNDESVTSVASEESVVKHAQDAYVLFYKQF